LFFLVYLGLAVGTTWPLVKHLTTHLPGHTLDTYIHYWNGWWVRQALRSGQSPIFTPYLFYPQGVSLALHNFAWIHILGWLGLSPLLGGFSSYNLVFLISLALCGWAVFLLARDLTGDARAAFLAGLIYQCWPYRMSQLDHPNLIGTYAIPLFLYFLARTLRQRRWRQGVLAGVFFALVGYTRWQLLIPAAILGGIYLIFAMPRVWDARRQWIRPLLLAGGVAALALTPPAMLLVSWQSSAPTSLLKESEEAALQTDLMAYLTPSPDHSVLGSLTDQAYSRYYSDRSEGRRFAAYVGLTTLLLAVLGLTGAPHHAVPWLAIAGVMISLALGVNLQVGGQLYPTVPMPYRLASRSFVVRLLRFPDRFSLFVALPMAVLAAYGARELLKAVRNRSRWITIAVVSLLSLTITFEYLEIPVPLNFPESSSIYARLADEPGGFGLLNLPIDPHTSKRYMLDQTVHQHPILQGHVSRSPEGASTYLDNHPLLRGLRQFNEMDPELTDVSRQLTSLAADDVRYVVLQKQEVDIDRLGRWRRYLLIDPRFEDEKIAVFSTSPVAGEDFTLKEELASGIGPIHVVTSTDCLNRGWVMEVDVGWGATAPPTRGLGVELSLLSDGGKVVQTATYALSPAWATNKWPVNAIAWGYYPLRVDDSLPPASYQVQLALVDAQTLERLRRAMIVGEVRISESLCPVRVSPDAVSMNAIFGDELRLVWYRLLREGDHLTVTLHWRSEQRMEADYKFFVHVFDRETGVPVAQHDAMPRQWTYPTTFWGPGEHVEDEFQIDLASVPAGDYGVAVGVYDPQTMARLPVVDPVRPSAPGDRLVLSGEAVRIGEGP